MAKATRVKVPAEDFIQAWQKGAAASAVAEALGTKLASVKSRAAYYRKKGISLKKFPSSGRGAQPLDVARLNKLAKSCAPKGSKRAKKAKAAA